MLELKKSLDVMTESMNATTQFVSETQVFFRKNLDDLLGDHNSKQKGGAVGALTNGLILREETFALAVAYALAPFVSPHLY